MEFLLFHCVLIFNLNKEKHAALREMSTKCSRLCQGTLGNAPKSSWRSLEQYLQGIGNSLGNGKEYWRLFQQCLQNRGYTSGLNKSKDPMGAFPTRSPATRKQGDALGLSPTVSSHISSIFCPFPQSVTILLNLIKNWGHNRKICCDGEVVMERL